MLILKNARLVTAEEIVHGNLSVEHGRIAGVSDGPSSLPAAIDCEEDYVIPGIIDLHTDALEHYLNPRPTVKWPVQAALAAHDAQVAASGITTVFDSLALGTGVEEAPRMMPMLRSTVAAVAAADGRLLRAEHLLHLRLELPHPNTIAYCSEFIDVPNVRLLSLMDHTPGQGQYVDLERMRANFRRKSSDEEFQKRMELRKEMRELHAGNNRETLAAMARERDLPLASHDDRTVDEVELAKGLGATICEFPVAVEAAEAAHERGMTVVMGGPNLVLGGSHSGNAAAADVARGGWLHALASDYVPASILQGVFLLNEQLGIPLPAAVAMATSKAARSVGLHDRGAIANGFRGDLVRVRLSDGNPFVISVWRAGERVL